MGVLLAANFALAFELLISESKLLLSPRDFLNQFSLVVGLFSHYLSS